MGQAIQPILAMIDVLPGPAIAELERALRLRLRPSPAPADRRVAELGFLAELMAELLPDLQPAAEPDPATTALRRIDRSLYDSRRRREATGAPQSARLVERYGSWLKACRAADGLLADGRYLGVGKPWRTPVRGRLRAAAYTREEVRAAIRACATELGCRPTANVYYDWVRKKRARALEVGTQSRRDEVAQAPRLPTIRSIYRLYPEGENRWAAAVDDAAITDAEIAEARRRRFAGPDYPPTSETAPIKLLRQLSPTRIEALGVSVDDLATIEADGFEGLPLSQAAAIAHELSGSLDWLAGRVPELGEPARPETRCDGGELTRRRCERGLAEGAVREALGLALGPYRRLLGGSDEPSLEQVARLAGILGLSIDSLCVWS